MRKPLSNTSPKKFDIGLMNKWVRIETQMDISDGGGGFYPGWGLFKETWARSVSIRNEWLLQMGGKITGDNRYLEIRYDPGINKSMRVIHNDLSYRILESDNYNDGKRYIRLECEGNKQDG